MITQWQLINWKVSEIHWIQKSLKIHYFKRLSLKKINILKFAGEILCLPLELMLPPSLHTINWTIVKFDWLKIQKLLDICNWNDAEEVT